MGATVPALCPMAALAGVLMATSSAAVLSLKRLAASWAFAAGWAAFSSFTEYLGSTKAKSEALPALSATFAAFAGAGVNVIGTDETGAEASTSFGAALAATVFTDG